MTTTWRKEIISEMSCHVGETFAEVVSCTLSDEGLDEEFDDHGIGGTNGQPFTLWTQTRVYFPCEYDGQEFVNSVSRNPDGEPTNHI